MKGYNWKKGIIIIVVCAFIGAFVGGAMNRIATASNTEAFTQIVASVAPTLFIVAFVCGVIGICGYFYFNAKLKEDQYRDEEGSYYETHEKYMSVVMTFSTLCAIINFTAIGVNLMTNNNSIILSFLVINVGLSFMGEVANISLIKKVRPELDADPMDMSFKKDYFDKLDEYEKNKTGKACFKTTSAMTIAFVGMFVVCYAIIVIFEVSPVICVPVGILWFIQTVLMTYYSNKN